MKGRRGGEGGEDEGGRWRRLEMERGYKGEEETGKGKGSPRSGGRGEREGRGRGRRGKERES